MSPDFSVHSSQEKLADQLVNDQLAETDIMC